MWWNYIAGVCFLTAFLISLTRILLFYISILKLTGKETNGTRKTIEISFWWFVGFSVSLFGLIYHLKQIL